MPRIRTSLKSGGIQTNHAVRSAIRSGRPGGGWDANHAVRTGMTVRK